MATATAKKTAKRAAKNVQNFNIDNLVVKVKDGAKEMNDFMLENSEALVNEAIVRGEQWQDVAAKAVKGGLKLTANTQDIVFDTLDSLKGQFKDGSKRFRTLISKN